MCKTHRPFITALRVGQISYNLGDILQKTLANQPKDPKSAFRNYLLLQEFQPVYTIGIRSKPYTIEDEKRLRTLGADFVRTNRGGLITFHGPGQLVAYPVLHLQQFKPSMRWYVAMIEKMIIDVCRNFGIQDATTTTDTGIWVGNNKICAIGLHGSRYVTTHGVGLNCCTDLSWFEHIVPCGIEGKGVTSLSQELKRHVSVEEAIIQLLRSFSNTFNCDVIECNSKETEKLLAKINENKTLETKTSIN